MKKQSKAGSIYLFCIGLFLVFLGAGFFWLMLQSFGNASDTRSWEKTPCLIIRSEVGTRSIDNISKEYRWEVAYKYRFNDEDFIGEKFKPRGQRWRKSIEQVKPQIAEFSEGLRSECFVNPDQPEEAILDHDTKAAGYTLWFPALFSIGGLGMMVGAVRGLLK